MTEQPTDQTHAGPLCAKRCGAGADVALDGGVVVLLLCLVHALAAQRSAPESVMIPLRHPTARRATR